MIQRSDQEAERLPTIIENHTPIRMLRRFVNDPIEVLQDKLYQADLRLSIFKILIRASRATTLTKSIQSCYNLHSDKLATRLDAPVVPDPDTFAFLTLGCRTFILTPLDRVRRR